MDGTVTDSTLGEDEFAEMYSDYQRYLDRYAMEILRDHSSSEDVVAEAFIATLSALRSGSGPTRKTFISYMKVAVRNQAIRYKKRSEREIVSEDIEAILEDTAASEETPGFALESDGSWDAEAAGQAFLSLPDRARNILYLAEVENVAFSVIAKRLGMREQAVVVAAHRARETLRTNYLVEHTRRGDTCGEIKVDFLAVHARGKSPGLRHKKIEHHLEGCLECRSVVNRMLSLRLPVAAILGIATTGSIAGGMLPGSATGASASALVGSAEVASSFGPLARGGQIVIDALRFRPLYWIAGAGVVALAAALLWPGSDQNAPTAAEPSPTSAAQPSASPQDAAPETRERNSPAPPDQVGGPASTRDNPQDPRREGSGGGGQPAIPSEDTETPSKPEPPTPVVLPPGVRSVSWADIPATYASDSVGTRLLLTVDFDPGTQPSDYLVTVAAPAGVSLTRASAGCLPDGTSMACIPTSNILQLRSYDLQFIADVARGATPATPVVTIAKR